jgi:hypothetical protein
MELRAWERVAVGVGVALVCTVLWCVPGAIAAPVPTFTTSCVAADVNYQLCQVVIERDAYMASELSAIDAAMSAQADALPDNAHRSDLAWWGVWALVGLAFVSLIAAPWWRAFNYEGKFGRG